jgi:two-component system response regulator AtoC
MDRRTIWLIGEEDATELSEVLTSSGYAVETKSEHPNKIDLGAAPSLIVLNVMASGVAGLNLLINARPCRPAIPVIVRVAPHQTRILAEARKLGAAEALVGPVQAKDLLAAIEAVLQKQQESCVASDVAGSPLPAGADTLAFFSQSPKMAQIWEVARMVARTDVPVLILGESGVGKEVLARYIHRNSRRADKPLVKVNCAALPHDLLESELFGYDRGAFTGAVGEKPGKFELANNGCIILDEIGEMSPSLQPKLLHVVEDGEYCRLGGRTPIKVDVRIIALTNRKLESAIPRGEFRDDLYFRLNVVTIKIPPLRERREDIPTLCDYFLKKHRTALESAIDELPSDLVDFFVRYDWPGNIRQLENTVKRYLILPKLDLELGPGDPIAPAGPAPAAYSMAASETVPVQLPAEKDVVCLKKIVSRAAEETERRMVLHVLDQTNWNRRIAARRLNICYKALLNKLKKWQVEGKRAS